MALEKLRDQLSPEMVHLLQGKTLVLIQAFDKSIQKNISSALSWVFAINEKTIRFAIDHKSYLLEILESNPNILLNFIGLESVYAVAGHASIKVRKTEGLTLKLAFVEVEVEEVRDINFYGSKIVQNPAFIKTYNEDLAIKLDKEVHDALVSL